MKTKVAKIALLLLAAPAFFGLAPPLTPRPMLAPAIAAPQPEVSFDRDIRPIFAARCLMCHGEKQQSGGLRLDAKAFAMRGGDNGPVLVAGKAEESRLYRRVVAEDDGERMPPVGDRLGAGQVALLKSWIDAGAVWPEAEAERAATRDPRLDHWSWQPVKRPELPPAVTKTRGTKPGIRNAIDAFISARLARAGLAMSPEADRRTLIRRLFFDLVGLPPTPERVRQFVNDPDPRAYERLVDELLGSPHYGERWARHWLDVVHYGDTHGYDKDKLRPNAWPYRDYVIRSFNAGSLMAMIPRILN